MANIVHIGIGVGTGLNPSPGLKTMAQIPPIGFFR